MANEKRVTPKQQRFVDEYLVDLNGTQAAIRAGYSVRTAAQIADEILRKPHIAEAVEFGMKVREARTAITQDRVVQELARIAFADIAQAFDESGNLLPIHQMPVDVRRSIASIESFEERDREGVPIGTTRKVKWNDKLRALELLGKHLGLFETKVKISGDAENPIRVLIDEIQGNTLKPVIDGVINSVLRADA